MKIQYLAVVFIIIMLPISLILSEYTKGQIQTLQLQISYDSKLDTATHDAVKAYQLNSANSDTSDIADSKIRDIEASINTFFNSISTGFNMVGYNQDILIIKQPTHDAVIICDKATSTMLIACADAIEIIVIFNI